MSETDFAIKAKEILDSVDGSEPDDIRERAISLIAQVERTPELEFANTYVPPIAFALAYKRGALEDAYKILETLSLSKTEAGKFNSYFVPDGYFSPYGLKLDNLDFSIKAQKILDVVDCEEPFIICFHASLLIAQVERTPDLELANTYIPPIAYALVEKKGALEDAYKILERLSYSKTESGELNTYRVPGKYLFQQALKAGNLDFAMRFSPAFNKEVVIKLAWLAADAGNKKVMRQAMGRAIGYINNPYSSTADFGDKKLVYNLFMREATVENYNDPEIFTRARTVITHFSPLIFKDRRKEKFIREMGQHFSDKGGISDSPLAKLQEEGLDLNAKFKEAEASGVLDVWRRENNIPAPKPGLFAKIRHAFN